MRPNRRKVGSGEIASKALKKGKGAKEKWKIKPVGGFPLQWDPYGDKVLVRFATEEEHAEFVRRNGYRHVLYNGTRDKAVWFATMGGAYDADFAAKRPWKVTVYVEVNERSPLINFESDDYRGEAEHRTQVIVKNNESGAYGIGRDMIDTLRSEWEENV